MTDNKILSDEEIRQELAIQLSGFSHLSEQTSEQNHYFWKGMHKYWKNKYLKHADVILALTASHKDAEIIHKENLIRNQKIIISECGKHMEEQDAEIAELKAKVELYEMRCKSCSYEQAKAEERKEIGTELENYIRKYGCLPQYVFNDLLRFAEGLRLNNTVKLDAMSSVCR